MSDARRLLAELAAGEDRKDVWDQVEPFLVPGDEMKAKYAFDDLWEASHGNS